MMRTVKLKSSGFTLVEVLVAIVFLTISMLAVLHALGLSVEHNMTNIVMDEAVRIAEQRMNELRNTPVTSLVSSTSSTRITIARQIRNKSFTYTVDWIVEEFSADSRAIQVIVQWPDWRDKIHRHTATSIVSAGI
ncbi:MAG: prepilin-type N-terminal cleavage/methylation domain-containing protein [Syntrophorhabdus sp.]|jgi:Tfp pilus assembly protein PilV